MRRDRLTFPLLLLLTLIAAGLRFVSLERPTVWGDEAQTYGRVAGTYQQLLDQLADSSFPPLHYEVEWWIAQGLPYWGKFDRPATPDAPRTFTPTKCLVPGGIRLTPFALRFVPAAAGTLFVPAVFFLAVQLFGRRVALVAAGLACFSAYALVYSRDAKMYMHLWLFVTLHVACALWWLRTRRVLAWACWVLCGVVMVGLHASGFGVFLVDALVVFTTPGQHWRHFWAGGRVVLWSTALLPARAYTRLRRTNDDARRPAWQRVAVWRRRATRRFRWPSVVGFAVGVAVMASAAQGPLGFYSSFSRKIARVATQEPGQPVDLGELGIGWVSEYNAGRTLPGYVLFTLSSYLTGWEWPRHYPEIGIDDQAHVNPQTLRMLQGATLGLLGLLAVGVVPWRRLFSRGRTRFDRTNQDRRVWRPLRTRRALWLAVWLAAVPWVTYTQSTDAPLNALDGAAGLLLVTPPHVAWPRCRVVPDETPGIRAKTKQSLAAAWAQWPAAWHAYAAAWTRPNVSTANLVVLSVATVVGWKRRVVGPGTLRLVGIAALLLLGGTAINLVPRLIDSDIWMPRYIGTVLPAFFVLVAVLIDRQPVVLRWATVGLFVVANLCQFTTRVWGQSEPPTALMAIDVIAAQPRAIVAANPDRLTFRAYTYFGGFARPDPAGGTLFTPAGRYYLHELSGLTAGVLGVRSSPWFENEHLQVWRFVDPVSVDRDLRRSPQVERFVVWSALRAGQVDPTDALAERLRGRFRRAGEELWNVSEHWRWYDRWQVRRRTYERVPAATRPTTRPLR